MRLAVGHEDVLELEGDQLRTGQFRAFGEQLGDFLAGPVNPENQLTRSERAQATRRRILDAAHRLFAERGYAGTRMADIATEAGVAVQTVYFTFHTKAELLDACVARGVMGGDEPRIPQEQPFWIAMVAAQDAREAVRHCEVIDHLDTTFGLRRGLAADTATDILLTMGSHHMYCSLVHDYGWSHAAFVDWLSGALGEMLLDQPEPRVPRKSGVR